MQTMTLEQLRATTEAGGVLGVTLLAQGAAFYVNIETRRGEALFVSAKEKKPRKFIDPRKAMMLLREIGVRTMRVNAEQWIPEEIEFEKRQRPDSASRMKQAFEAKGYRDWLTGQVQEAINDPRPSVPHSDVAAAWATERAALVQLAESMGS